AAQREGAKGLAWVVFGRTEPSSPLLKFLSPEELKAIGEALEAEEGDLLLFVADAKERVNEILGRLRRLLAEKLELIEEDRLAFCWVVDWPLFEWDDETKRYYAKHHPFTSPKAGDISLLAERPDAVRAEAYDLVLNGVELGGGSIRIHQRELQEKVFQALGLSAAESREKFGFLLEAFSYGAPPHGGIALGLDR